MGGSSSKIPTSFDEAPSTDRSPAVAPRSMRTAKRPMLMVLVGKAAGRVFRIERDRTVVGRSVRAGIVIDEHGVSRRHCAIVREDGATWVIEDLGSKNGTLVNGFRQERAPLSAGDRVQLGPDVVLQFGFYDDAEEGLAVELYDAATRDPLTRAHNRRYLMERLSAELSYATRHGDDLSIILLDVDRFKAINDEHGHLCGDSVLRNVADIVAGMLRAEDVFARYGGEEFVVLARGLGPEKAALAAERIRRAVEARPVETASGSAGRIRVTVSAGVAALSEDRGTTASALLTIADGRLYRAKQAGRNRVVAG